MENRDGIGWCDAFRQVIETVGRHDDLRGRRALPAAVSKTVAPDEVAGAKFWSTPAVGRDSANQVATDNERERCRYAIDTRADQRVDGVDRRAQHVDEDIGRTRLRGRQLPDANIFGRSELFDISSAHKFETKTSLSECPVS